MKKFNLLFVITFFLICSIKAQNDANTLNENKTNVGIQLTKNSNGKINFLENGSYLIIESSFLDSNQIKRYEVYDGFLINTGTDSISLEVYSKESYYCDNGIIRGEETIYAGHKCISVSYDDFEEECSEIIYKDNGKHMNISKMEINSIYKSSDKDILSILSGFSITGAVVTGLIISPLASINYKKGGFNRKRFFKITGYSFATLTVSVPLLIISNKGKYYEIGKSEKWRF